jgi:methionyl-tRNA formyltransferase
MLPDVAMLAAPTARTRAYLAGLRAHDLSPAAMVLVTPRDSAGGLDIESAAAAAGISVAKVEADTINDPTVVAAIAALEQRYVIFSGPGGAIVKTALFATGKRFIHVHPGRLPDFRGSTTIYYSLLAEKKVEATALFLDERIDCGPLIGHRVFDVPRDRSTIDHSYDPSIRAELLVSVLRDYVQRGGFEERPQPEVSVGAYYVVHPILKHLAILAQ